MPRRKQDCPKRMKWEGGEEGDEEDAGSQDSKNGGDDATSSPNSPMSPASVASRSAQEEEQPVSLTPGGASPVSPISPAPMIIDGIEQDSDLPISMIQDPLSVREAPLSRCPSRDSRASSVPRCSSRDSQCSDRMPQVASVVLPAISPVAVALPAVLPPTGATGLLPPNTAALAAYLGAAAVVAQQTHHRLLMTPPGLPHSSVSPLLSSSPPPILSLSTPMSSSPPLRSPAESDSSTVLDFSTKRSHGGRGDDQEENDSVLNLSKPTTPVLNNDTHLNSPLDLSVSSSRKRGHDESSISTSLSSQSPSPQHHPSTKRSSRSSTDCKTITSPWTSPIVASQFPFIAAAVAAANSSFSPKHSNSSHSSIDPPIWNGKLKIGEKQSQFGGMPTPSDATKALEKMSELSKIGGDDLFRPVISSANIPNSGVPSVGSSNTRHSAWQSHWLNKGAESAKDVLKCVWCKQSFPSLAAMTTHMKEAKHCGVNVPPPHIQAPPPLPPQTQQPPTSSPSLSAAGMLSSGSLSNSTNKPSPSDLNLLIKETMPLPRKLVRGQDVWLGKGAEQTRQILKCMWCGQSFRSLAEMTSHMQQTQHYTNIISQEQIISWKSSDDTSKSSGGPGSGPTAGPGGGASSTVSAVLTCKVCDQAFSSLKELSNHMVKNSHYKEHIMRSITESGGRRRQTREKRKKSLPVRKLLELERAQHELKNGDGGILIGSGGKLGREPPTGRITCEKCGDKIETSIFVDHIRQCVGGGNFSSSQRNLLKNALLSSNIIHPDNPIILAQLQEHENRKSISEEPVPPVTRHHRSPSLATDLTTNTNKETSEKHSLSGDSASSASVLNAIEKLIEKSFDSRTRHSAVAGFGAGPGGMAASPMGSSILKRLGIDESVDYTKPLVDCQTMNILRNYHHHSQHQHQHHHYSNRRERSGSESSSISDRGGGRTDSLTPDRKPDISDRPITSTPRATPEKRIQTPSPLSKVFSQDDLISEEKIKKEPIADDDREDIKRSVLQRDIIVKKEVQDTEEEDDDRASFHSTTDSQRERREDVSATQIKSECHESREDDTEESQHNEEGRRSHSSASGHSPAPSPHNQNSGTPEIVDGNTGLQNSPCRNSVSSPASSDRSGTPRSTTSAEKKSSNGGGTSLVALSTMFDSLSGGSSSTTDANSSSGKGSSSHPLAALQKLCDKTERHSGSRSSSANVGANAVSGHSTVGGGSGQSGGGTTAGTILPFIWACNDAVVTGDSIMKCAFCDTPFISKGAYRHHLSKMHFVKDGIIPDPVTLKVQQQAGSSSLASSMATGKSGSIISNVSGVNNSSGSNCTAPSSSGKSPQQNFEESPHSKFLKYTELAKQLSSKYV